MTSRPEPNGLYFELVMYDIRPNSFYSCYECRLCTWTARGGHIRSGRGQMIGMGIFKPFRKSGQISIKTLITTKRSGNLDWYLNQVLSVSNDQIPVARASALRAGPTLAAESMACAAACRRAEIGCSCDDCRCRCR